MLRVGYTREDIRQFREELKQTLTPVYRAYLEDFYSRAENRTQPGVVYLLGDPAPSPQGSWQQTLQSLEEVYNRMQEQAQGESAVQTGDCYAYLLSHEMIDAARSSVKANVTFSTLIYSLNTPFLFANMDGSAEDVFSGRARVLTKSGADVTAAFVRGACAALALCRVHNITEAVLKAKSPSCGCGAVYDGTFSGRLVLGDGLTTALFRKNGISVQTEQG